MPALTPSRLAVVVVAFSLLTFFWTFGLPHPIATPAVPHENHDSTKGTFLRPVEPFVGVDDGIPETEPRPSPTSVSEIQEASSVPATSTTQVSHNPSDTTEHASFTQLCRSIRGAGDVMIVLKTSAAELYSKLPTHLLTLIPCAPHFAIFSDHAGSIAGHPVHDALENITQTVKEKYKEFGYYYQIRQQRTEHQQLSDFQGEATRNLDKWKFLPMLYSSYQMRPETKFFLFIEADTSISWANLLQWISRLDPSKPYFAGAPAFLQDQKYAQRGSGFLLSNTAMKMFSSAYEERYVSEWESKTGEGCCGDVVLTQVLEQSAVQFKNAFPLLQGESPGSLDWTENNWCSPVVSWHHVNPEEIDLLWEVQREWTRKNGWHNPHTLRAAFHTLVSPFLIDSRPSWDNLSNDLHRFQKPDNTTEQNLLWYTASEVEKNSINSPSSCAALCEKHQECLQWRHRKGECGLGKVIRLGRRVVPKGKKKQDIGRLWESGWMVDRVRNITESWGDCKEVRWEVKQAKEGKQHTS